MDVTEKPRLLVTVFSDYICPFCYIGDVRLEQLRAHYDVKINWCFLEIHPETSEQGEAVTALGYEPETWKRMMESLTQMADAEGLSLARHSFTTNSHRALLLAESANAAGSEVFYTLHRSIFEAFFCEGRNIGDPAELQRLAGLAGLSEAQTLEAWSEPRHEQRLLQNRRAAEELGVRATPTFFMGEERLDGAVPLAELLALAQRVTQTPTP